VVALTGCGKDAPTSGTVEVRGSGQEWSVASSKAETSKDGYNVKVLVKLDPKAEHSEYLPWAIEGDLTSKYDGDESGQGALKNWCHSVNRPGFRSVLQARMEPMNQKYSPEMRERALRMLDEAKPEHPNLMSAVRHVAGLLGMSPETLRVWHRRREIDAGQRPGVPTDVAEENKRLRRENAELKKANEVLKAASVFFAKELDRP